MAAVSGARPAVTAGLCSVGAAAIHAVVALPHFEASALLGLLFVVAAVGQCLWAALVLARPSTLLVAAGIVGNLAIVTGWMLSRTTGLPIGPDAWHPEPVTALDATATGLELVVVGACLALAGASSYRSPRGVGRSAAVGAAAILALVGAAFVAAPPAGGHDHVPASNADHQHDH